MPMNCKDSKLRRYILILCLIFVSGCCFASASIFAASNSSKSKQSADGAIDLVKSFVAELKKSYGISEGDLKVEILAAYPKDLNRMNPVFLPMARVPLKGGVVTVMAAYTNPEGKSQRGTMTVRLRKLERVLVASAAIKAGDNIEDKVVVEDREALGLPSDCVIDTGDVRGKVARISIPKGIVVTNRMIESPKLVKRGDPVVIVAGNGDVEITATGEALMDGQVNMVIRVKNLDSQKVIAARVTEKGKVIVELP